MIRCSHEPVADIVKLYEDPKGNFINIPGRSLSLDPHMALQNFTATTKSQHQDVIEVRAFDSRYIEYANTTPMKVVMENDFILKLNNDWYNVLTDTKEPLFEIEPTSSYQDHSMFNLCQNVGLSQRQSVILGSFTSQILDNLQKHMSSQVDRRYINMLIKKSLLNMALEAKSNVADLDARISFLKDKLSKYEEVQKITDQKLEKKSKRRVRLFFSWIFTQILLVQYGTYVAFNWDVMEPITCLLGVSDLIIAYSFWLFTNTNFSYENMKRNYVEKYKSRFAKADELDLEEIDEIKQMLVYLESKKLVYSEKMGDTLEAINIDLNLDGLSHKKAVEDDEDDE